MKSEEFKLRRVKEEVGENSQSEGNSNFSLFTLNSSLPSARGLFTFPILAWRHAVVLLETFVEIRSIENTHLAANLKDVEITMFKQLCGDAHAFSHEELVG